MAKASARAAAARAVAAVFSGSSLDRCLEPELQNLPLQDRGLAQMLCFEVLRHHRYYNAIARQLLKKPLPPFDPLQALILIGLHQLLNTRIPAHAAINETVAACQQLGKPRARGLINAVLRNFQRDSEKLLSGLSRKPPARLSYPDWLASALGTDWGARAEQLMEAGNQAGPMILRANRRMNTRDEYLNALSEAGLQASAVDGLPDALRLAQPCDVSSLPGFGDGRVSVQDGAAQVAVELLNPQAGQRVLDACAAPGGKAAQLLERMPAAELLALDIDPGRSQLTEQTLARCGLNAVVKTADASATDQWWDGRAFDRILLDAPCSGTGVIRRHPDIKWLRRAKDIPQLAAQQAQLLRALWPCLKPGGQLLYATCSILKAEGDEVISAFLAEHADAQALALEFRAATPSLHGLRIAPGGDFDGFYYSLLQRKSS